MNKIKQYWRYFYDEKLAFIDNFEESLSTRMQQFKHKYDSSFKWQRNFTYTRAFVRFGFLSACLLSMSTFIYDRAFSTMRPVDITLEMLSFSNDISRRTYIAFDEILNKGQELKELDSLSYAALGQLYASVNQPDLAQCAFYMAHLKNPTQVLANSDLQFETTNKEK